MGSDGDRWTPAETREKLAELRAEYQNPDTDKIWARIVLRLEQLGVLSASEVTVDAETLAKAREESAAAASASASKSPTSPRRQLSLNPVWKQRAVRATSVVAVAALFFFLLAVPLSDPATTRGFQAMIQRVQDTVMFWQTSDVIEDWNEQMERLAVQAPWFVQPVVPEEYRPVELDYGPEDNFIRTIFTDFTDSSGNRLTITQLYRFNTSQWELSSVHDGTVHAVTVGGVEAYWITWNDRRALLVWAAHNVEIRMATSETLETALHIAETMIAAH